MISLTVNDPTRADAKILRAIADALDAPGALERLMTDGPVRAAKSVVAPHGDGTATTFTQEYLDGMAIGGTILAKDVVGGITADKITAGSLSYNVNTATGMASVAASVPDVNAAAKVHEIYAPSIRANPILTTPQSITPEDNPAAGAAVLTYESAHGSAELDPANVFGAGAPVLPNVPSPTPTPPPLPLPNLPISTPPSPGAASDSPPPPPPPAPAPVNASAGAATTSGVQTDKAGMPWDARIHASTKATIADGTWKKRRGVDAHVVSSVEQQLRAAMAVPAPTVAAPWPFPADSSGVTGAPTFASLMQYLTPRISAGTLTQAHVTAAVQSVGLESLNLVMARIDLIPGILAALREVAP